MALDPGILTQVQSGVITQISGAFGAMVSVANSLLYFFAAFEVVLFGLFWALQGGGAWVRLLGALLKIGLLIFVIDNFPGWLEAFLESFAQIGSAVGDTDTAKHLLLAPGDIWNYGYNAGVHLLKTATEHGDNLGLTLLLVILGCGILLVFGWLGIQLVLRVSAFYILAFVALILMPIGAFRATSDFAYRSIRAVLQAGIALLVLLVVLTIATPILQAGDFSDGKAVNINEALGLFFAGLLFTLLAIYLPAWVMDAVGHIRSWFPEGAETPAAAANATIVAPASGLTDIRAAVQIDNQAAAGSPLAQAASVQVQMSTGLMPASAMQGKAESRPAAKLNEATSVSRSISSETLRRLHNTERGAGA